MPKRFGGGSRMRRASRAVRGVASVLRYVSARKGKLKSSVRGGTKRRTRTRTMVRKRKQQLYQSVRDANNSGHLTFSKFQLIHKSFLDKVLANIRKTTPDVNYTTQDYGVAKADSGFQQIVFASNGGDTFNGSLNSAYTYQTVFFPKLNGWMNGNNTSGTGSVLFAGTATNPSLIIKNAQTESIYTNQSNSTAMLYIYNVIARNDEIYGDSDCLPYDVLAKASGMSDVINGTSAFLNVGASLFEQSWFLTKFKVLKVTKVSMLPGQNHSHKFFTKVNRKINLQNVINDPVTTKIPYNIGKLTTFEFGIFHGLPTTEESGTSVSTAPVRVSVLRKIAYSLTWVQNMKDINLNYDNLSTLASPLIITDSASQICDTI